MALSPLQQSRLAAQRAREQFQATAQDVRGSIDIRGITRPLIEQVGSVADRVATNVFGVENGQIVSPRLAGDANAVVNSVSQTAGNLVTDANLPDRVYGSFAAGISQAVTSNPFGQAAIQGGLNALRNGESIGGILQGAASGVIGAAQGALNGILQQGIGQLNQALGQFGINIQLQDGVLSISFSPGSFTFTTQGPPSSEGKYRHNPADGVADATEEVVTQTVDVFEKGTGGGLSQTGQNLLQRFQQNMQSAAQETAGSAVVSDVLADTVNNVAPNLSESLRNVTSSLQETTSAIAEQMRTADPATAARLAPLAARLTKLSDRYSNSIVNGINNIADEGTKTLIQGAIVGSLQGNKPVYPDEVYDTATSQIQYDDNPAEILKEISSVAAEMDRVTFYRSKNPAFSQLRTASLNAADSFEDSLYTQDLSTLKIKPSQTNNDPQKVFKILSGQIQEFTADEIAQVLNKQNNIRTTVTGTTANQIPFNTYDVWIGTPVLEIPPGIAFNIVASNAYYEDELGNLAKF